jgi:hypothetical protein
MLGVVTITVLGGLWLFTKAPASPDGARPTAIIWTATPTPTATPVPTPTLAPVPPDTVGVGVRVMVTGTGDVGLSIRAEPNTTAERLDVALEGETLLVVSGPQEADNYTWWFVRDEATPEREGWVAADYLIPTR